MTAPARDRLVVAAASLFATTSALVATTRGLGANATDSVAYLTMADDVAAGLVPYPTVIGIPPTHLPPGWSVLVGGLVASTPLGDAMTAARLLNAVCAGLLPVVVYLAVRRRARGTSGIPALMAVVVAASYPLFELAARAVVEPWFVLLLVVTLLAVERVGERRNVAAVATAAGLASLLTLTRFVGVAVLLALGLEVAQAWPRWRDRLLIAAGCTAVVIGPTVAWVLHAPGSPESSHFRGDTRAGMAELGHSLREAGVTVVRGEFVPAALQAVLGVAVLATPLLAIALAARPPNDGERRWDAWRRVVSSHRLGPWLWYLAGYTAIVTVQRWDIDREILARYWLPYWVLAIVVLGRCLSGVAAAAAPARSSFVRMASVGLLAVSAYNVAQIAVRGSELARDGVTINATRYSGSTALDELSEAELDVVFTDHLQLVELQLYVRHAQRPIEKIVCPRADTADRLVAALERAVAAGQRPGVALVRHCRRTDLAAELLERVEGLRAIRESGVGVVLVPERQQQRPL